MCFEKNVSKIRYFSLKYRKLPLISPGLRQLRKGSMWAYGQRDLYPKRLVSGIENHLKTSCQKRL